MLLKLQEDTSVLEFKEKDYFMLFIFNCFYLQDSYTFYVRYLENDFYPTDKIFHYKYFLNRIGSDSLSALVNFKTGS